MNNQLATMSAYLTNDTTKKYLESMLGNNTKSFVTSLSTMVGSNPQLNLCDRKSILGCALKSVGLNLPFDPNLGFCYAIPYKDGQTGDSIATFQMGVKGFIQLALRSGQIRKLNVMAVKEGEFIGRDISGDPEIKWLPESDRVKLDTVGYMAYIQTTAGFEKVVYWSVEEVQKHAEQYSQAYRNAIKYGKKNNVVWIDNFDKMAEKTVLKALISRYAPMSVELQEAIKYDQSAIVIDPVTGEEEVNYVDNVQDAVVLISKEQLKELASLIPKDKKISDVTIYKAIKDIPEEEFENVKKVLMELKGEQNVSVE